jgi:hypothetical protein
MMMHFQQVKLEMLSVSSYRGDKLRLPHNHEITSVAR